jgi:flagellar assembly factor FliW
MKCVSTLEREVAEETSELRLPIGLLGFEHIKDYVLLANPEEEPFGWLQVRGDDSLAFVVIDPFLFVPNYQPDIPQADVEFLGLKKPNDAALLNIVTIHGPHKATVNLKGPVVINRHTHIGKQVVLVNAADYSVHHPLPVAEVAAETA